VDRQDRRDADSAIGFGASRTILLVVLALIVTGIIGGVWWGVKVATSDAKGAGDAQIKINSGDNRINAQETFEQLYQQIQAYDRNLDQAAADKAEHPGDSFYATNYSGLVKTCNDAVFQYNAEARKVSRAKWRDPALPFEIDTANLLTDCKETAK
jgi:hypothetical protein